VRADGAARIGVASELEDAAAAFGAAALAGRTRVEVRNEPLE
jgi:hypothetical protein